MWIISGASQADSLVLTCDFKYDAESGAYYEIPANCIHTLNRTLKSKLKDNYPRELPREYLVLANPPACPTGYKEYEIYQGGMTSAIRRYSRTRFGSSPHDTFSYQVRRICLSK